ncbi:EFR1 family ferrodoxin [Blautia wexlerae]|uniref:EFR1 family ferrodoxin n=1 Tax=Blautia wexlerae TaxID=418240 RepID=UPI00325B6D95
MVIYFSGTGNSKYITDRIAGGLQEKLLSMDERIKSGNTGSVKTGENLIVVVPTYAWRIPRVVSDWIGQTEFVGAKNVWYVMSCGSGIGGADIYNRKLSEKKGIKHMGTAQIIMPENYIAMFNAPDVEKAKKIVVAAGPAIAKAVLAIKHGEHLPERKYGLGGRMESGLVNSVFYPVFVKAQAFHTDQTCTGCGKCVKVCPLNNVTMKDKKPVWGSHCTHCMACICHCPAEAIEYGRKSVGKPRYCFENLGIEEKGTLLKDQ